VADRSVAQDVGGRKRQAHHLLAVVDQLVEAFSQLLAIEVAYDNGFDGVDLRTVPIVVEDPGELRNDIADDQRVHIDEVLGNTAHEILVRDVASPGDGDGVVGNEKLIVHAMIETAKFDERSSVLPCETVTPATERIEQPNLDVGERGQPSKQRVAASGVEIVDQEANPNPTQRRIAQVAHQQAAGLVVLYEIVLEVE